MQNNNLDDEAELLIAKKQTIQKSKVAYSQGFLNIIIYGEKLLESINRASVPLFQLIIKLSICYLLYRVIFNKEVTINIPQMLYFNFSSSKIDVLNYGYLFLLLFCLIFFGKKIIPTITDLFKR